MYAARQPDLYVVPECPSLTRQVAEALVSIFCSPTASSKD